MAKVSTREVIFKKGEPKAVILDIKEYQKLLEKVEEAEDIKEIRSLKKKKLKFRILEDFLNHKRV